MCGDDFKVAMACFVVVGFAVIGGDRAEDVDIFRIGVLGAIKQEL